MGSVWNIKMVLLSTLAALVIIVHSLDEDLEAGYHYELRPRVLDTRAGFEQPWTAMKPERSLQPDVINARVGNSAQERLKRRRPGRKRKRRPDSPETHTEDQIYRDETILPNRYIDYSTTEMPRRRRKRPEVRPRWIDEHIHKDSQTFDKWLDRPLDKDRPLRRRSQRRKRPHELRLSEFNVHQGNEHSSQEYDKTQTEATYISNTELSDEQEIISEKEHGVLKAESELNKQRDSGDTYVGVTDMDNKTSKPIETENKYGKQHINNDKSLSEFSVEDINPVENSEDIDIEDENSKLALKNQSLHVGNFHKAMGNDALSPETLKQILKKSNGSSLSEMLQKHNLSLTDLLHGSENAISLFKTQDSLEYQQTDPSSENSKNSFDSNNIHKNNKEEEKNEIKLEKNIDKESKIKDHTENSLQDHVTKSIVYNFNNSEEISLENKQNEDINIQLNDNFKMNNLSLYENRVKIRLPIGTRKTLRMKPFNNTSKSQLNRDLIESSRKKYYNNRNTHKSKEWRDVISVILTNDTNTRTLQDKEMLSTTKLPNEMTTLFSENKYLDSTTITNDITSIINKSDVESTEIIPSATTTIETVTIASPTHTTEKTKITPILRLPANNSSLRRQVYNNRLKRKRLKLKNSTTEDPQDDSIQHTFGNANLVSASEFISKIQPIHSQIQNNSESINRLTTVPIVAELKNVNQEVPVTQFLTTPMTSSILSTTEKTAKIEIEEILNDTYSRARLSKILMERNMSFNELVEHRERGSSHVHLADIFHNASKEPNPPEPFLAKSLLEPISKEIYPLRALLEANLHETTAKTISMDPNEIEPGDIPVVLNFGNNVNENGENMGIMSLFNRKSDKSAEENTNSLILAPNITISNENSKLIRDSVLHDNSQDIVSWNDIFTLMQQNNDNVTGEVLESSIQGIKPSVKKKSIEDVDGDGLIILEDLQHSKDFKDKIASESEEEKFTVNIIYEKSEAKTSKTNITDRSNYTKSVTVATASIVGLTLILFLLTYAIFKWNQQRMLLHKKGNFSDDRIPSPVFENRKGHKNNSSMRSISPMLSSGNIYTMNTLDSHNDKESPDYMGWDTLRKPFQ